MVFELFYVNDRKALSLTLCEQLVISEQVRVIYPKFRNGVASELWETAELNKTFVINYIINTVSRKILVTVHYKMWIAWNYLLFINTIIIVSNIWSAGICWSKGI